MNRIALFLAAMTISLFLTTESSAESVSVSVERLGDLLVERELHAPATVIAANQAEVRSQVAALIMEVLKDVGDDVAKGDLLIRLDDANARLALAETQASLAAVDAQIVEANSRLAKALELLEKSFVSDEELISREAAVAVLQANRRAQVVAVEVARLELSRTKITAPYAAAIIARQAQVGSYAQPGTQLLTLVQTDQREVEAELDPRYIGQLQASVAPRLVAQGAEWPLRLLRLSSVIDSAGRIVKARFAFSNDVAPIGTTGQLVWRQATGVIPVALLVQRGSKFGVFVVENDSARFVAIDGAQEGRPAMSNLPADTNIVSRGHVRLQDGDEVVVSSN